MKNQEDASVPVILGDTVIMIIDFLSFLDLVAAGVESEEDLPLKYALGKLRSSQLEEMMTKEELEEERRSV